MVGWGLSKTNRKGLIMRRNLIHNLMGYRQNYRDQFKNNAPLMNRGVDVVTVGRLPTLLLLLRTPAAGPGGCPPITHRAAVDEFRAMRGFHQLPLIGSFTAPR